MTIFIVGLILGFAIGWCGRSFQFGMDQECADPKHKDTE